MIIAQTKLRKIPDTCIKCKFCKDVDITKKSIKANGYMAEIYMQKKCYLTGVEVPYVYNTAKQNWEYAKCKSCPLIEAT